MRGVVPSIFRGWSLVACGSLLACGDSGKAGETSTSSATQVTSVSEPGTSDPSTSQATQSTTASTSGQAPTEATTMGTTEPVTTAPSGTDTDTDTDTDTGPGDPSASETGFDTGFDCVQTLQATVRDFRVEHPDFEDFTSETGLKGIVEATLGPDMKPVYAADGPTAQTSGPADYAQWYNNTPDTNIAFAVDLLLTEVMPGLFSFESNAFFPVDDQGWGNQGQPHNFHFTTEIHTTFNYQGGEVFTFIGDDDLWLFINGELAIDLGGVHPELSATVDLDAEAGTLGIAIGGAYAMDIFHAERHTVDSNFRIDTSIQCFIIPG